MIITGQPFVMQYTKPVSGDMVTVCLDGRKVETLFAGKLMIRDRYESRYSVCGNVRGPVHNGQFFRVRSYSTAKLGGGYAIAGNIVAKFFKAAQTPLQCAGLQLAVWEAIEDGGKHADFGSGRFMAKDNDPALEYAEAYYEQGIGEQGDALFLGTEDDEGQSQITVTRV